MTLPRRGAAPIIQLEAFEGPLDLLLTLVERRRLPIVEVSLAAVAEQYLAQVRALESLSPEALSEFLTIATRLLHIKSKALLPHIDDRSDAASPGEEVSAAELARQLETYRAFKLLAADLGARDATGLHTFTRGAHELAVPSHSTAPTFDLAELLGLAMAAEARGQSEPVEAAEAAVRATVAERVTLLRERLAHQPALTWDAIAGETVDQVVATLLAVLELVRRGELLVDQPRLFGPILLTRREQPPVAVDGDAGIGQAELT
ncbi:MAG: segregation/condensation protein A [Chloroflexi bacterium]|nr:segregation/condensation protein A [Chloroflexota bacterium]